MTVDQLSTLLKGVNQLSVHVKYKPCIVYDSTHGVCLVISLEPNQGFMLTLKDFDWDNITGELALAKEKIEAILAANGKKASENSENREPLPDSGS